MNMKKFLAPALLAVLLVMNGCASEEGMMADMDGDGVEEATRVKDPVNARKFYVTMRQMAAELAYKLKSGKAASSMVVVTTFVPVDDYEHAGSFGNLCAEQMLIGLSEQGFRVYDMRKAREILVKEKEGIFSLSNSVKYINANIRTDLVLVGSYTMVGGEMVIDAMLVGANDNEVISSATRVVSVEGDRFLEPIVHAVSAGKSISGAGRSIAIREPAFDKTDPTSVSLPLKVQRIAMDISKNLKTAIPSGPVVVTTYVDLDYVNRTNSFGRYVTERLMEELTKQGFKVVEVRASKEMTINPRIGEMALSRNADEVMHEYQAKAVVVGTYQKLGETVKVHTRLITPQQEVISVANTEVRASKDDKFMEALFMNQLEKISLNTEVEGYRK